MPAPPLRKFAAAIADDRVGEGVAEAVGGRVGEDQILDLTLRVNRVSKIEANRREDRIDAAVGVAFVDDVAGIVDTVGVVAPRAEHKIGSGAAVDDVVALVAEERVGEGAADKVLDLEERKLVAGGIAAKGPCLRQTDANAGSRRGVTDGVDTVATEQEVGAGTALEKVVAVAAKESVDAIAAKERVVAAGAVDSVLAAVAVHDVGEAGADPVVGEGACRPGSHPRARVDDLGATSLAGSSAGSLEVGPGDDKAAVGERRQAGLGPGSRRVVVLAKNWSARIVPVRAGEQLGPDDGHPSVWHRQSIVRPTPRRKRRWRAPTPRR